MKTIRMTVLLMMGLLLLPFFANAADSSTSVSGAMGLVREIDGKLQVITVDRWETQYRPVLQGIIVGETPVAYVQRVIDQQIRPIDASFADRLDQALTQVLTLEWVDSSNLQLPSRVGRIKGNYKWASWNLVQLLERKTVRTKGQKAKVTIQYNKELFKRLETFDIALLLMHETIFMLNSDLKQNNSYEVRKMVAKLMAHETLGVSTQTTVDRQKVELAKALRKRMRGLDLETQD